jgi:hydroxymethylglutaryl-CoA lyase
MATNNVILEEQGLRDGLQTIPVPIPTATKAAWIRALVAAGISRIQVASFVHPKLVPQMADAEEIVSTLPDAPGVTFSALALNLRGVERAAGTGIRHLSVSISASDTHGRRNANRGLKEAMSEFREMAREADAAGIIVRGGIQCAFGCRYEGLIAPDAVLGLVKHHLDCGVREIALADSTGMGHPKQVREMMEAVVALAGPVPVALHLHNTENKGYANVAAALEAGVRQFDTAFGGLGGCPFIRGATGNIATEDTAHMLHQMGHQTGIDIRKVAGVSREMEGILGKGLPGLMYGLLDRDDIAIV